MRAKVFVVAAMFATVLVPACAAVETPHPALAAPEENSCAAPKRKSSSDRLTITYFGTSTLAISDGRTTIMTDGFFSRPSVPQLALRLRSDPRQITAARTHLPDHVAALFVAHSHFDHAMDSAAVARDLGADVYGSLSTRRIVVADGLPEARTHILDGPAVSCGDFTVEAVPTAHSPTRWAPGEVPESFQTPAFAWSYREGGNYSFIVRHGSTTLLVIPSANMAADPHAYDGVSADLVFLGIGSLGGRPTEEIRSYWAQAVGDRGAGWVVPIHWDNFTRGLDKPVRPISPPFDHVQDAFNAIAGVAAKTVRIDPLCPFETLTVDATRTPKVVVGYRRAPVDQPWQARCG